MFKSSEKVTLVENPLQSELENLKSRLKASELRMAQLEGIQSAMPDPYYVRDMDYNIILWPPAIAKLTGFSGDEAKKKKCYDMFRACVCPPVAECPTQRCVQTKQFLRDVAVDVYHKNGDTVHCLVSNAGVYDEDGNTIGAVEIVKDNTVVQNTMNSITEIIKKIDAASDHLGSAMEQVNTVSRKVSDKSAESLADIKIGVETGFTVSRKADDSSKYIGNVQTNINNINDSMKFSVDKISSLREKSEAIIEFIKMIQEISSKTNLLSINASIEAAHAGESGRGFKVVADGIRELSKNSNESAQSINATVKDINDLIKEVNTSFAVTEKDIEAGTNTIAELLTFVNEISESVKELMNVINITEKAAESTSDHIREQNTSFVEVSRVGRELSTIAKNLTLEFEKVIKAIQHTDMG